MPPNSCRCRNPCMQVPIVPAVLLEGWSLGSLQWGLCWLPQQLCIPLPQRGVLECDGKHHGKGDYGQPHPCQTTAALASSQMQVSCHHAGSVVPLEKFAAPGVLRV